MILFTPPPKWADKLAADAVRRGDGIIQFRDIPMRHYRFFAEMVKPITHNGRACMSMKDFATTVRLMMEQTNGL